MLPPPRPVRPTGPARPFRPAPPRVPFDAPPPPAPAPRPTSRRLRPTPPGRRYVAVGFDAPEEAHAALEQTDAYLEPLDREYSRTFFRDKSIPRDLYLAWNRLYGEWLAYRKHWGDAGISPYDAATSDIAERCDAFRRDARAYHQKLRAVTGKDTTTPLPPEPPPKPAGTADAVQSVATAVMVAALVGGTVYLVSAFSR